MAGSLLLMRRLIAVEERRQQLGLLFFADSRIVSDGHYFHDLHDLGGTFCDSSEALITKCPKKATVYCRSKVITSSGCDA